MKKVVPLIGKDDLNLVEVPFTLLSDSAENGKKTLKFTDKQSAIIRHWTITGSDEYGLPCAYDEPVFIAMLALTKRGGFISREVHFNPYEILKITKWQIDGKHYDRLALALKRLAGVTIYTDYFWDRGEFKKCLRSVAFHILEESLIDIGTKSNKNSYFIWGERLFKSFQNGNIKNLDLETYFDLKTPISKRFYRLWDKRLYKNDQASFDLKDLCHEKLGITRNMIYPSELKRKLGPALQEHVEKKLLSSASYTKGKDGSWLLNVRRCKEDSEALPLPEPLTEPSAEDQARPFEDPLLEKLLLLKIPLKRAEVILQTYPSELIEGWIDALDLIQPQPKSKAGYLTTALKEGWELPEEVIRKRAEEDRERLEELQREYEKYILAQVDAFLKTLNPAQVEKEISEHKEIYFSKLPKHFKEDLWESESMKPRIERDYKLSKATELKLPSFDEWKLT